MREVMTPECRLDPRGPTNLWILLRLGPVGWLLTPDFLQCVGISGLPAYGKLKQAAASLFLHFGHPALEQFVQNL